MIADYVFTNKPTLTVLKDSYLIFLNIFIIKMIIVIRLLLPLCCNMHDIILPYSAASSIDGVANDVYSYDWFWHRKGISLLPKTSKKINPDRRLFSLLARNQRIG